MNRTTNTPAFPNHPAIHSEFGAAYGQPGMTLRQYAAIQIAAGLASSPAFSGYCQSFHSVLAEMAIATADALLAELAKKIKQ